VAIADDWSFDVVNKRIGPMPDIEIPPGHKINLSPKHPLPIGSKVIGGNGHPVGVFTSQILTVVAYRARFCSDRILSPKGFVEDPDLLDGYWLKGAFGSAWMEKRYVCSVEPENSKSVDIRRDRFEMVLDGL
jgi:hypothetical protein